MKTFEFLFAGKKMELPAEKINGSYWVQLDGETLVFDASRISYSKSKAKAGDEKKIVAPMPGKIIKLLGKPGTTIEAHSTVVVMEAMKMEYTLKAVKTSTIKEIFCNVGDQVQLGQVLAELEPS